MYQVEKNQYETWLRRVQSVKFCFAKYKSIQSTESTKLKKSETKKKPKVKVLVCKVQKYGMYQVGKNLIEKYTIFETKV